MHALIILVFALHLFTTTAFASSCDPFDEIHRNGLSENAQFWEEFGQLSSDRELSPAEISALIKKHKSSQPSTSSSSGGENGQNGSSETAASSRPRGSLVGTQKVTVHRNAEKHYASAPEQVKRKLNQLVELFEKKGSSAVAELRQHHWNYEYIDKLKKHSIRLNDGFRALITVVDDKLTIWDVGNNLYPH
jgi:hypothetical protein